MNKKSGKRIHVLLFESEDREAIDKILHETSGKLSERVSSLSYEVEDTLLRLILASLREGAALSR